MGLAVVPDIKRTPRRRRTRGTRTAWALADTPQARLDAARDEAAALPAYLAKHRPDVDVDTATDRVAHLIHDLVDRIRRGHW